MLFLCGCDPSGSFELARPGGSDPLMWSPDDHETLSLDSAGLRHLANDVGRARYHLETQNTAYLFQSNLGEEVSSGQYLALPRFDPDSPLIQRDGDDQPWMVFTVDSPSTWSSARVYDSGECSVLLDWDEALLPPLLPAFADIAVREVDTLFAACDKPPSNETFVRVSEARVTPVLRSGSVDTVRFSARYRAQSIGGCSPVNLDVSFELGFRKDSAGDIVGLVENVWSEVDEFCIAESAIEDKVNGKIRDSTPAALTSAVRERFLLNPTDLGFSGDDIPACTADADCETAWRWGGRCKSVSGAGQCWIQVDVDRVNIRPEGVEFVLFENDDDPQRALLTSETPSGSLMGRFLCGEDRLGDVLPPSQVSGTFAPTTLAPSNACD